MKLAHAWHSCFLYKAGCNGMALAQFRSTPKRELLRVWAYDPTNSDIVGPRQTALMQGLG